MFSASENPAPVAKPYTMASIVNPILLILMRIKNRDGFDCLFNDWGLVF